MTTDPHLTPTALDEPLKVNARHEGWTIRGYRAGDYYADIYCPHGRPVEVTNTDHQQIYPRQVLLDWYREAKGYAHYYCDGHR